MKGKLSSMFLLATMWLAGTNASAELTKNGDGAYLIGSKADLLEWSRTAGYESSNAVLTADIDNLDFRLCTGTGYSGTFDGGGHTVTVSFNFPGEMTGMFVKASNATVRNLIVKGEIKATYKNAAALVGDGSGTFENVLVDVSMHNDIGANASNAAIVGYGRGTTFRNCVAVLKVDGRDGYNGGLVGWIGNNMTASASNCISIVQTELPNAYSFGNPASRFTLSNCFAYQQDMDGSTVEGVTYLTSDALASGEVCYTLNNGAGKTVFYQNLGEDLYPVPFSSHKEVYAIGEMRCDGTPVGGNVTYSNTNTTPAPKHNDVDGWCSVCGKVLLDHLTPDAEGFYPLATAADVEWFSALVSDQHMTTIKGKLTADIDFDGVENAHKPIGPNGTYKYNGEFDGQGHRIKGMVLNLPQNGVGFFGQVRGGTIIRNVIIDRSCEVTGNSQVGGLIGLVTVNASTPILIDNCVNEATVTGTGATSGIVGAGASGYPVLKMTNCLNTGDITGSPATAFCSWINMGGSSLTNCVNTGVITGMDNAGNKFGYLCNLIRYEPNTLNLTNCYDLSESEEIGQGLYEDWLTDEPLKGGELCYLLNGDQSDIQWYQKIDNDETPVPYFIEGGRVYPNGEVTCDGLPTGDVTYSNEENTSIPPHEFEYGFCINCDAPQPDFAPMENGFYIISEPDQLYWFSRMVNEHNHGNWNAKLAANIDMEDLSDMFTPIGTAPVLYSGHFDGQGHVISNLNINAVGNFAGFFGQLGNGAVIENFMLDETCSINSVGECVALVGGTNQMNGTVVLRNLGNMGSVFATGKQAAGIFGGNAGSQTNLTIQNCFTTGYIEGGDQCAAIVGWAGSKNPSVSNCWTCSEVVGNDYPDMYLVRHANGVLSNLFATMGEQGIIIDYEEIEDGQLCYRLNGDQASIQWYQNIDNDAMTDAQPVPFSNGHARVYPKGKMLCDGSVDPTSVTYSNSNESIIPDHTWDGGFCSVCGQENPDYEGFIKVIKNADFNVDSFGWEGTGFAVANGVASQTNKTFDTYQKVAGLAHGVYRLHLQGFSRSAELSDEEVYGEGELSDDILRNTYVYAESDGKRVARRLMDITAQAQEYRLTEAQAEQMLPNETYVPASIAGASAYFAKGKYRTDLYFAVSADTTIIGFSNQIQGSHCQSVIDRLRLEYVGNDDDAFALIAQQIAEDGQQLNLLESQQDIMDEYEDIVAEAEGMTEAGEIIEAADKAARYPDLIKLGVAAYEAFYAAVEDINKYYEENNDRMVGEKADLLEAYLTDNQTPSTLFPNGTYAYIRDSRLLGVDELKAETAFAQNLLSDAIKENPSEGMELTHLIVNPRFADGNWNGWTVETFHSNSGSNMTDNAGFTDIYPVAAGYNTGFEVSQTITGLPNGVYELQAFAFHRPGQGGQGAYDASDIIPASLFINDYATPVKSVYADILDYSEAFNGVNCRYDAATDENAPHNGEETGRHDYDIQIGYVPDDTYSAGFAFNGGRYLQKAYAVVTDGTLRLGIRNGEWPWHDKNLTVWADFRLFYQGKSIDALCDMAAQYIDRAELLDMQRLDLEYYMSAEHLNNIRTLSTSILNGSDADKMMVQAQQINEEFKAIPASAELYAKLLEIDKFASDMADGLDEGDLRDYMNDLFDELNIILVDGSLNDKQAAAKVDELMASEYVGGVYVQGDLYDNVNDMDWDYSRMCSLYPLTKNAQGIWTGDVTVQDRSRRANADQRAGLYFRRFNTVYKCGDANRNFITPEHSAFSVKEGGSDFQTLNGTFAVALDLDNMTVSFRQKDEMNWDNQVYVTGTLNNRSGAVTRWQNSEHWPLQHVGNGVYVGMVDMVRDNSNPFCSFGIIACRATTDMVNYSTTARSSWTEARYGSEEQYLNVKSGETVGNLVRGLDRTWRIADPGKYIIEFDMNKGTMKATLLTTKGNGTAGNPYLIANVADLQSMQDRMVDGQTTYFRLTDDIDMEGRGWWPLNNAFFGNSYDEGNDKRINLEGDGHIIRSLNIFASQENDFEAGFFGALCGDVKGVGFFDINLRGGIASGNGILAGKLGADTYDGTVNVENSYFNGSIEVDGVAGGIAGRVEGSASILDCYANAVVSGSTMGDLVGNAEAGSLMIQNSYAGGAANGSEAKALVGKGSKAGNALYFDGSNISTLVSTVSNWAGWAKDGTIGNGFPILQWQVERGDYTDLCGYGESNPDAITDIASDANASVSTPAYTLSGQRAAKNTRGIIIQDGRKMLRK